MPRRKIGADLKEAICKLYEAGDISADTIEKHGIMSRATFFRNLKLYKSGLSLEQRHSTGRKTNADKLKEQEKRDFDQLQPSSLQHLELVLLDDRYLGGVETQKKNRVASDTGYSKAKNKNDTPDIHDASIFSEDAGHSEGSGSDTDSDHAKAAFAACPDLTRMVESARSYWLRSNIDPGQSDLFESSSDLDTLATLEDSQYSHKNRGAMFVVRTRNADKVIIAAIALRSLIWTPQVYQALGQSYASRSIDRICFLSRLHVDSSWRHLGIGRWLVRVAELQASKLGFSHLFTQSKADYSELLKFWSKCELTEFARFNGMARLEKQILPQARYENKKGSDVPALTQKSAPSKRKRPQYAEVPVTASSFTAELSDPMDMHSGQHGGINPSPIFSMTPSQQSTSTDGVFFMHAPGSPSSILRPLHEGPPLRKIAFHEADPTADPAREPS